MGILARSPLHPSITAAIAAGGPLRTALLAILLGAQASTALAAVGLAAPRAQLFYETGDNVLHPPTAGQELGQAVAVGDFDGDGNDDLAIGIHWDDHGVLPLFEIGQVQIRWGAAGAGLENGAAVHYLWQGGSGVVDEAESGDHFGEALAVGDFDDDGFDDLAVGIPGEDIGTIVNAGAVEVRYGAADRFAALQERRLLLHEDVAGVPDQAGVEDRFGEVLATGDLDGDSFDELLVGVPSESVAGNTDAGRLFVFYGSFSGTVIAGAQTFDEETSGIQSDAFGNDHFARAVVAGDWNGNGFDDLAIGVDHWGAVARSGGVHILYSNASGPNPPSDLLLTQDTAGIVDTAEEFDGFGAALGTGDWNGDGYGDLAIGVPYEDVGPEGLETLNAGVVHVLFGSQITLLSNSPQYWSKSSPGFPGDPAEEDRLGSSFAAGDFDDDGDDELAIGILGERVVPGGYAGAVTVLAGSPANLESTFTARWDFDQPGIPGTADASDYLGLTLATGDFDGDGHWDLALGAPGDEVAPFPSGSGSALVLYGSLFCAGFEGGAFAEWSLVNL